MWGLSFFGLILTLGPCCNGDFFGGSEDDGAFNLINGIDANIEEFPFYGMIIRRKAAEATMATGVPLRLLCGSSLIHPKFIITAYHCFKKNRDPYNYVVVYHIMDRCLLKGNIESREFQEIYFYPNSFTGSTRKVNDIALAELFKPIFDITTALLPINPPIVGSVGTVIGFGRTAWSKVKQDSQLPCILRKTYQTVEAPEMCHTANEKFIMGAFCAATSNTTACRGDSGGPWLTSGPRGLEVQGLSSFGAYNCDPAHQSDHYTNVYYFKPWILFTIKSAIARNARLEVQNRANRGQYR